MIILVMTMMMMVGDTNDNFGDDDGDDDGGGMLLARVLKEGVQFWYKDTSTVRGGGGCSRKRSSGKPLKFTLLHLFQARSNFFKHTWLCEFVPPCFFT